MDGTQGIDPAGNDRKKRDTDIVERVKEVAPERIVGDFHAARSIGTDRMSYGDDDDGQTAQRLDVFVFRPGHPNGLGRCRFHAYCDKFKQSKIRIYPVSPILPFQIIADICHSGHDLSYRSKGQNSRISLCDNRKAESSSTSGGRPYRMLGFLYSCKTSTSGEKIELLNCHSERSETKRRNLPLLFLVRVSRLIAVVCFSTAVFQAVDPHVGCEAHPPQDDVKGACGPPRDDIYRVCTAHWRLRIAPNPARQKTAGTTRSRG